MRLARVVVRLPAGDKQGLDRLRHRYFEETQRGLSRAALIRILVQRGLIGADAHKATDLLLAPEISASSLRSCPPQGASKGQPHGGASHDPAEEPIQEQEP